MTWIRIWIRIRLWLWRSHYGIGLRSRDYCILRIINNHVYIGVTILFRVVSLFNLTVASAFTAKYDHTGCPWVYAETSH